MASPKAAEISREIIEERLKSASIQPLGLILGLIPAAIIVFAFDFSRKTVHERLKSVAFAIEISRICDC